MIDNLRPGRNLYLLATGTGLAPFLSIIKDPETYLKFARVVLVHGCRYVAELPYSDYLTSELPRDEILGETVSEQLLYYPVVTREQFRSTGRITELMRVGEIVKNLDLDDLSPEHDRVMVCGNVAMMNDAASMLRDRGFKEGHHAAMGDFVVEKAFAGK